MKSSMLWGCLLAVLAGGALFAQTQPANDNFTNAFLLSGNEVSFSGTLSNATAEPGEPYANYFPLRTVWWKWVPATNGPLVLQVTPDNTGGGKIDAEIQVFLGTGISQLTYITGTTLDIPAGRFAVQSASFPTNWPYYFRVAGSWQGSFNVQLRASGRPTILQQPENCTVPTHGSAAFCALAAGTPAPCYQWMFNGTPLAGQTAPILLLHNIQTNAAGPYSVIASNSSGTAESTTAWLAVTTTNPAPRVTLLPIANAADVQFVVQGEPGRWYRFETTYDLQDWFLGNWAWYGKATNEYSVFSVPSFGRECQFVKVALNATTDGCVAQLKAMYYAAGFLAIENNLRSTATYSPQDLAPYFRGGITPACPGFGAYSAGATVTNVPTCSLASHYNNPGHQWP